MKYLKIKLDKYKKICYTYNKDVNKMENLITDINKCVGQKLIDADNMENDNVIITYEDIFSFLVYMEWVKNDK